MSERSRKHVDPHTLHRRRPSDDKHPMRSLLAITAAVEAGTGVALAIAPSAVVLALLGSPLDPAAGSIIGRLFGAALFSLGAACWIARGDAQGRMAGGLVAAMLLYNVAAVSLLGYARIGLRITGVLSWPAIVLHSLLAAWCVACLRIARRTSASGSPRSHPRREPVSPAS
jgi:hypothetical protein